MLSALPRILKRGTLCILFVSVILAAWIYLAPWPSPETEAIIRAPDVIVVLGGGDLARVREAIRLASDFSNVPILVTGDGGYLESHIRGEGVPDSRILLEKEASSTWENASFSGPFFQKMNAHRIAVITNWYHVVRARAVFEKQFPELDFVFVFEPRVHPENSWERPAVRREKFAAVFYAIRYGVWCLYID
jgi:uncharacterized SAM-binding protein YcdF (DUF218 family)